MFADYGRFSKPPQNDRTIFFQDVMGDISSISWFPTVSCSIPLGVAWTHRQNVSPKKKRILAHCNHPKPSNYPETGKKFADNCIKSRAEMMIFEERIGCLELLHALETLQVLNVFPAVQKNLRSWESDGGTSASTKEAAASFKSEKNKSSTKSCVYKEISRVSSKHFLPTL
jgi:hypothetical protein